MTAPILKISKGQVIKKEESTTKGNIDLENNGLLIIAIIIVLIL